MRCVDMSVQFAVLASGSRGNSTLVRGRGAGLLIDVGIGPKAIGERLESVGATWSRIAAAVLTHTHGDHVDTGAFAEMARRGVFLHCHEAHRTALSEDTGFRKLEAARLVRPYDGAPFLTSTGLRLEPIELKHDGGPTFGFRIEASSGRRQRPVSIGYLADTGTWSETMVESLADVDLLGVEFNHDVRLQMSSPRPSFLIERNLSDFGHLSNRQGADLLQAVFARSRANALSHVVLLHLSEQCNQPHLAIQAAGDVISAAGRNVQVHAARQSPAFPNLWVGPRANRRRAGARARPLPGPNRSTSELAARAVTSRLTGLLFGDSEEE
jgi:phosphoribosyl 1,2-cyclic phosphodiesterase